MTDRKVKSQTYWEIKNESAKLKIVHHSIIIQNFRVLFPDLAFIPSMTRERDEGLFSYLSHQGTRNALRIKRLFKLPVCSLPVSLSMPAPNVSFLGLSSSLVFFFLSVPPQISASLYLYLHHSEISANGKPLLHVTTSL